MVIFSPQYYCIVVIFSPQYYCIVVIFSQTPEFLRSLHSFLDKKQTLSYTQSPLQVFTLSLSHTNRRLPTKATHNNNRTFPDRPIGAQSFTTVSGTKPGPPGEEETWSRGQCKGRQQVESAMRGEGQRFCTTANKARGRSNVCAHHHPLPLTERLALCLKSLHHSQQSKGLEQCL